MTDINLYGRVIITADIKTITGLHIGASNTGLEIGGVDKAVIRNPLTDEPYIPGSSLRGKMRSQTEKVLGASQNNPIGQ
ncbi:MAG: RAMP superfamily CRISPR-associated protein [Anaerolineales bacterium]|jgi:CRISPR-associated protein Csm3|nr:RAMP superfamily CRISPR-associated protein [Anaerolineales bacterium]